MVHTSVVFVLGGPGSGKGTQCERIIEKYGWGHLSTGDLLRSERAAGTPLGQQVDGYMQKGALVPDEVMLQLLKKRLGQSEYSYILLDGFPRTVEQARQFEQQVAPCAMVLYFSADDEVLIRRLLGRGRADDNETTIANRLKVFHEQSYPVIEEYSQVGKVIRIDATRDVDVVFKEVVARLDEMLRKAQNERPAERNRVQREISERSLPKVEEDPSAGCCGCFRRKK